MRRHFEYPRRSLKPSEILSKEVIEPEWIVKDMIPRGTMIVLAGEAGAGKSYLMYNLLYAISSGRPFLDHATVPTKIVYFDEENGEPDFLQYNQWAWAAHGGLEPSTLDRWARIEHRQLVSGWKMATRKALREHSPGLVIFDTATPCFHIQDENDNGEAQRVIQELARIRAEFGDPNATFIILKHERQRDDTTHRRTIRGAKAWLGAVDQVLYHVIAPGARRRKDGTRKTRVEPDKLRAFALDHVIEIDPVKVEGPPNSLILRAKPIYAKSEPEAD